MGKAHNTGIALELAASPNRKTNHTGQATTPSTAEDGLPDQRAKRTMSIITVAYTVDLWQTDEGWKAQASRGPRGAISERSSPDSK